LDYISFLLFQGYSKVEIAEIAKFLGKIAMILGGFAGTAFTSPLVFRSFLAF
jgi:hypothetical protein